MSLNVRVGRLLVNIASRSNRLTSITLRFFAEGRSVSGVALNRVGLDEVFLLGLRVFMALVN